MGKSSVASLAQYGIGFGARKLRFWLKKSTSFLRFRSVFRADFRDEVRNYAVEFALFFRDLVRFCFVFSWSDMRRIFGRENEKGSGYYTGIVLVIVEGGTGTSK